jgi:transcriptional regulator with PAS, ATPase and Fis domain
MRTIELFRLSIVLPKKFPCKSDCSNWKRKSAKKYSFESIVGKSKAIQEAISLARKVAVTDTTVLLLGETGTGKEVFAQAIHNGSLRKSKPFVAVNCSAFTLARNY